MAFRIALTSAALAAASLILAGPASAQVLGHPSAPIRPDRSEPALTKVDSALLQALALDGQGRSAAHIDAVMPHLRMERGLLRLEARLVDLTPELLQRLEAAGLELSGSSSRYRSAWGFAAPAALPRLAAIPEVVTIHTNYPPVLWTGAAYNQADATINADDARASLGIDGSGITVGTMSDSFHDLIGGAVSGTGCGATLTGSTPQLSGDLPASVIVLDNGPGGGSDEGAAQAELIHDIAPGAAIMFHTAFASQAAMATGITELAACGADVIVDDVQYYAEPMFQDGIIAQAVDQVATDGVVFFSSAGNAGSVGVDEFYTDAAVADDTTEPPTGNDFHRFSNGTPYAAIGLPGGCGVGLVLQWNEPFSGTLGPGASSDLDLYLCTAPDPSTCAYLSATRQGCGAGQPAGFGDPLEILLLTNSGGAGTVYLAVEHHCGDEDVRFRIATYGQGCELDDTYGFDSTVFNDAQMYGHAVAEGAISVAAAFYGEVDTGGNLIDPSGVVNVEPFSSLGGEIPIYYDASGNALAFRQPMTYDTRFEPDITAPDGGNTTFFGSDIGFDPDGYPNFFGTSASAPNAAGAAALVLESISSRISPYTMRNILQVTTLDIESEGWDSLSGAGVVDAYAACLEAPNIFSDGFESGDTSEWSN